MAARIDAYQDGLLDIYELARTKEETSRFGNYQTLLFPKYLPQPCVPDPNSYPRLVSCLQLIENVGNVIANRFHADSQGTRRISPTFPSYSLIAWRYSS